MHIPHAVHIDFYSELYNQCRSKFHITNNVLYPLVVEDKQSKNPNDFLHNQHCHTCTSGSMGKFERQYQLPLYFELIPDILKATNGKHSHIGFLSKQLLTRINENLKKSGIETERFIYIPHVESVWQFFLDHHVDVYISSFPIGGGRACVEAMGAGIPIVFHNNYRTPILGATCSYPEGLFWRDKETLLTFLNTINKEILKQQSIAARKQYARFHASPLLKNVFDGIDKSCSSEPMSLSANSDLLLYDAITQIVEKDVRISELEEKMKWLVCKNNKVFFYFKNCAKRIAIFLGVRTA